MLALAWLFLRTCKDIFGLRQRITACFARPSFLPIQSIREACTLLSVPSQKPEHFLAALLFPVLRWNLQQSGGVVFRPCAADGARELTDMKFNEHVQLQKESFLVEGMHEDARMHGKMRTKHDRLVLPLHYLDSVCRLYFAEKLRLGDAFDLEGVKVCCATEDGFLRYFSIEVALLRMSCHVAGTCWSQTWPLYIVWLARRMGHGVCAHHRGPQAYHQDDVYLWPPLRFPLVLAGLRKNGPQACKRR